VCVGGGGGGGGGAGSDGGQVRGSSRGVPPSHGGQGDTSHGVGGLSQNKQ
jgi:hypothetical protein